METKWKRGWVLCAVAVLVAVLTCTASATEPSDAATSDGRMVVEAYTDTALVLSPGGWMTGAQASGSALAAGLEWSDGMLVGTIATPGSFAVKLVNGGDSAEIRIVVSERPTIGGVAGDSLRDVVLRTGVASGTMLFDASFAAPRGVEPSFETDGPFEYDPLSGAVHTGRQITASDVGTYHIRIALEHGLRHGGLTADAVLDAVVLVTSSATDPVSLAAELRPSVGTTIVVTPDGTDLVPRDVYASAPVELMVDTFSVHGDGRDVAVSLRTYGTTDAVVEWGDGVVSDLRVGTDGFHAYHTYADDGTYTVSVQVSGPTGDGSAIALYGTGAPSDGGEDGMDIWVLLAVYLAVMAILIVLAILGYVPVLIPIVVGFGGIALVLINGGLR